MTLRQDIPYIEIYAGHFQEFDRGESIKTMISQRWNLHIGDRFAWTCAQLDGVAEVVDRKCGDVLVIKKIN